MLPFDGDVAKIGYILLQGRCESMKSAKQLFRKYESNKKALITIEKDCDNYQRKKNMKIEKVKAKLERRLCVLQKKYDRIAEKARDKIYKKREKTNSDIERLNRQITKFERIVKMLKLKVDVTINDSDISKKEYYTDEYFKWIDGYLYDDKYLKIRLMICENPRRPVRKYAVIAVGKTPLARYMVNVNLQDNSYGLHLNPTTNISFLFPLRHFSSTERAEKWVKRKKKTNIILQNIIYEYNKVRAEYLTIIRNYRKKDNLMELIEAKEMAEKL
jgi:hypothetical protein